MARPRDRGREIDRDGAEAARRVLLGRRRGSAAHLGPVCGPRQVYDLDEAMRRSERYIRAGADGIFIEAPRSVQELERIGRAGAPYRLWKFRTMRRDAEEGGAAWATDGDPRVLPVGRLLRRTRLDELPQLWNVLRGEMSLVGPRPTSFGPETYKLWHTERLHVLPGMTGLWQILGRASLEFDDRLRLDIIYIERRCMLLDMLILLKTVGAVFKQRGAH